MKIKQLSTKGIESVFAYPVEAKSGELYFCATHGENGRGRWQLRFPIPTRIVKPESKESRYELNSNIKFASLNKQDSRGNPQYLIVPDEETSDNDYIIFWHLSPGFRGCSNFKIEGQADLIARGEQAQGAAGRMGGADCPVVRVTGPCVLSWTRGGRLYGSPAKWVAEFDGENWTVNPADVCSIEEAALNY